VARAGVRVACVHADQFMRCRKITFRGYGCRHAKHPPITFELSHIYILKRHATKFKVSERFDLGINIRHWRTERMFEMGNDSEALEHLRKALEVMKAAKPQERSELARRYAISITELEKVLAYFVVFVESEL
jgi:hypothetical protein